MGYTTKTAAAAATGAEKAVKIHGLMQSRYESSHSRPIQAQAATTKWKTMTW